jgi:hypothetical protein
MKAPSSRNLAASVSQRLLEHSRRQGEDHQYLLMRYGLERWMYRLGQSAYANLFVVKGARKGVRVECPGAIHKVRIRGERKPACNDCSHSHSGRRSAAPLNRSNRMAKPDTWVVSDSD